MLILLSTLHGLTPECEPKQISRIADMRDIRETFRAGALTRIGVRDAWAQSGQAATAPESAIRGPELEWGAIR